MKPVEIIPVENQFDARGDRFSIPLDSIQFGGKIQEMHFVSIEPQSIRGNHYHTEKTEFIFLIYYDKWRFAWSEFASEEINTQDFVGQGAVLIKIGANITHAIQNTGKKRIQLLSCADKPVDANHPDTFYNPILK